MLTIKRLSILFLVSAVLSACGQDTGPGTGSPGPSAIPVDVAQVVSERLTAWDKFTGRLESPQTVSLRPRVSGYIDFVAFEEGEWVEQGQTLFLIDNRAFKAEAERLEAQLAEAESRHALAVTNFERAKKLRHSNSVSEDELDARRAAVEQASAAVAQTQAALDVAKLNRGFARVEAPISGRISRASVTAGNFVSAGQTELTTIVSTDRLFAYFDIDEQTYLNATSGEAGIEGQPVAMRLANENRFMHLGQIDFVDNQVNPQTGTLSVRAVFDNTDGRLLPGLFAHLKLAGETRDNGILVAERAIGTDLNSKFVLVVTDDNTVAYRAVSLGDKIGNLRIIRSGLDSSDNVIVDGLQRVRPGALVAPNTVSMADEESLAALHQWQSQVEEVMQLALKSASDNTAGR
ncbi:efflux RND transporter periplasmic adaptor subunit [Alteromonas sp. CYL-A6]|uniref:efflux RND transporter periplasmic adaptor subunit n=1 Tax=Alteromonas nitratireducens TaxID=3390813 RepID=UPI0034C0D984